MTIIRTIDHGLRRLRRAWAEMDYAQQRSIELLIELPGGPPTRARRERAGARRD